MPEGKNLTKSEIALELTTKFAGNLRVNANTHEERNQKLAEEIGKFYGLMYDAVEEKLSR